MKNNIIFYYLPNQYINKIGKKKHKKLNCININIKVKGYKSK